METLMCDKILNSDQVLIKPECYDTAVPNEIVEDSIPNEKMNEMEDECRDDVAIKIENMWDKLKPPPTNECCIYKVPKRLRKLNPDAYTPKVVSIGPFHHGREQLLKMEGHKQTYCMNFIVKRSAASLDDLIRLVRELEPKVRGCYSEDVKLIKEEFIKVILVDCCFTLELLLRDLQSTQHDTSIQPWLVGDISLDLMLIENQLPFFILQEIYDLSFNKSPLEKHQIPSFRKLASDWCARMDPVVQFPQLLPPFDNITHLAGLYRYLRIQESKKLPERGDKSLDHLYSATELNEVGVKLKKNDQSPCFLDLEFSGHYLRIPQLLVGDETETILRNMVAFEQCHNHEQSHFTNYAILMDFLINTEKDVDILVNNEIIINWLGDSKTLARMFNGLVKNVVMINSNANFLDILEKLDSYCKDPCHKRMATLRRDYCSTPWRTAASFAAFVLLILTIIQTIFSILQVV